MDTFFTILKKTVVATVFVIFGFIGTYVPQDWESVKVAEAGGGAGGVAQESTQMAQFVADKAFQAASIAKETITAFATDYLYIKNFSLDGIAWALAKSIVSSMVQSLIHWINSGFQGSPAFVQDLQGFLINAADAAMGEYIEKLGSVGSFICSPFRLDIQIAIATQYQLGRIDQPAPTCTLSGIIDNLEGFTSGLQGSFGEGGWNDWFDITSSPHMYTKYGAALSAEVGARAQIVNAKGEAFSILDFGDGFLSGEICNTVHGAGVAKKDCFISKPGKIIQEALTFDLSIGPRSLIEADEVNEVIGAFLGQIANKAITGAAGLLGLGGANGSVTGSFDANFDPVLSTNSTLDLSRMQNARAIQKDYNTLATTYRSRLIAFANDSTNSASLRSQASAGANNAQVIMSNTSSDIITLNELIADHSDPFATEAEQDNIMVIFSGLNLYSDIDIDSSRAAWEAILK
ncbi:hypothetical protein KC865_01070 [Candidatus Kaiserbacteria bacterium]|nr:hypothetical protein [Candidatus Kaiserbacteria bacterium]USN92551.1 MAG: hypothetical protein H6782_01915 [Candidatus Nomurabacteria bacterium]